MARHNNPRYNRKRLVVAGIAAVTTIGVAVGIGIYGSAFADQPDPRAASEQCLPTDSAPPPTSSESSETSPPDETEPTDTSTGTATDQPTEQPTDTGTSIPDSTETKKGWLAGGKLLTFHPPNGSSAPGEDAGDNAGDNGAGDNGAGDNGDNAGDGDNGGQQGGGNGGGNGGDYGGPKPPEQAPEPPDGGMDQFPGGDQCQDVLGPNPGDFVAIDDVPPNNLADSPQARDTGSTGTFESQCGTNENGHSNSANFIVAPGNENGAQHTHDYVGNEDTDGFTDNDSLAAAGTTCTNGDQSTYYWPIVRLRNEGSKAVDPLNAHNVGDPVRPVSAQLQFRGNAVDKVEALPEFIRIITGDAKASTNGGANANAKWTCTGFEDRITTKYPLCPQGSNLVRISDFPGCWDGKNTDSANHRTHVAFADAQGACPAGFEAVPQLRITLTYELPQGVLFALDAFPDEKHNPVTDHADFVNVMSEELMTQAVDCINNGQTCK
ncbi:DUF1996 domain-containing protein [Actinophytocola sp.]|uniref:DUF1996 domain-containing protein n=1 Tax=Actinophytocola sp. TaxID=1872138 RepID=UPI002D522EA8|nr:DUF1996 domain-containing protein [Actinophytocola sp.]HYQ64925.1 DUF1996 domain-containing protein [Actinophytocola sp.]